jgi:Protein of unknown function (DUF3558)
VRHGLTAAALLLALAGCGGTQPGGPDRPGRGSPPDGLASGAVSPPDADGTSRTGGEPLPGVDPCALAPGAALARLQLANPRSKVVAGVRACRYRHDGATLADTYTVSVEILPRVGLHDLVGSDMRLMTINGRPAKGGFDTTGACVVSLELTATSRVDTVAVGGEVKGGCRLANDLAVAVEPRLPS